MKAYDVAIVGAGIVGAACANALAREGLSVIVLDQRHPAGGTTAAGMGHIVVMDDSEAQFALTSYSQKLWRELCPELPEECEYEHCGTIWVAADDHEMSEVRRKHEYYETHGIATEVLDQKALREAEPNLSRHLAGGLLVKTDAVVYQLAAANYLLHRAQQAGAEIVRQMPISSTTSDGAVTASGSRIQARVIINAAGASAPSLTPELKIRKRKGHLVITDRYPGFVRHQLVELGYLKSAHGNDLSSVAFNVQPRKTDQVLLGSSRQFDIEHDGIDAQLLQRMRDRACEYMPALRELTALRVWTGFRPATADNLPFIGKIDGYDNVYAAAGHEGLGITTSLGTAEMLADMIMGRPTAIPAEPYSPTREITEH